jgi:hypothetical protein
LASRFENDWTGQDNGWLTNSKTLIICKMQHVWQTTLLNGFKGGFSAVKVSMSSERITTCKTFRSKKEV